MYLIKGCNFNELFQKSHDHAPEMDAHAKKFGKICSTAITGYLLPNMWSVIRGGTGGMKETGV